MHTDQRSMATHGSRPIPPFRTEDRDAPLQVVADVGPVLTKILGALNEIRDRLAGAHKQWYTISEVAQLTGRSDYTVRRWIKENRLEAVRVQDTGPRGRLLIAHEQIRRLIAAGKGGCAPDYVEQR